MNVLKWLGEQVDMAWAIWCVILTPFVTAVLVQIFPLPTLGLIGLAVHYQFICADLMKRSYYFTSNEDYLKRERYCHSHVVMIVIASIAAYAFGIWWNFHDGLICADYTGDIPGMLPSLLQHVVTVTCPAP